MIGGCLNSGVQNLRIDGLTVTGSDSGGGILANGYDCGVQISNNRVVANYGTYGGGIRIGHTDLVTETVAANGTEVITPTDSFNRNPNIHHNFVVQNGATEAGGAGGITMGTGSNSYEVTSNYVCGNFSMADGGGLSHLGFSGGTNLIAKNKFIFNQTFNQSADPTGGGVFIGGQIPVGTAALEGTGNVVVNANLMQGNQAGAGAGGGMSIARTRRADQILLTNNMIVNNVAAYAGGGVAMLGNNSVSLRVVNNTIASNVSTATNRQSFTANAASTPSNPQVAGLAVLDGTGPALMVNNILWANRSYIFEVSGATAGLHDPAGGPSYRDLGRVAGAATFAPVNSLFTAGGVNDNVTPSPTTNIFRAATDTTLFVKANDFSSVIDRNQPLVLADTTVTLQTALTFDETGNFVNVIFSPLTLWDFTGSNAGQLRADYHLVTGSAAVDAAVSPTASNFVPTTDYDGETRPTGTAYDIGADEISPPVSVQPSSLAFGSQSINTTATQTLTVTNSGATAATVPTPTITGTNAGQFAFTNNCPASLAPSTSCTITVSFTPTSNGSKTATLNVITFAIPLSGTGVTPLYTVTPVLHAFGQQQVGTVSAPFAYTVTNTALSQGSLVLTGANAIVSAQFAAAAGGTCFAGISLPPGSSCTMNVTFNPTSNGLKTGTVAAPVTAGAAGAPALATGTGLAPNLSLGAGTFNFGVVANLANSTFTLTNNQTPIVATAAPFVIGSISAAKTNSGVGNYVVTGGTCAVGATLAVNATCTVIVQFQSPTSSLTTGTLTVSGAGVGGIGTFSAVRNLTGS